MAWSPHRGTAAPPAPRWAVNHGDGRETLTLTCGGLCGGTVASRALQGLAPLSSGWQFYASLAHPHQPTGGSGSKGQSGALV